ncbi:MAG: tRNA(Met) cytidine acetyltransferase TmcA domain-containing protein, partial [Ectothiorhodospiraceae bacterium]
MTLGLGGLAAELVAEARARGHRRLLVLAGEAQWARGAAQSLLADTEIAHEDVLWAGASSMPDACVACAPGELVGHIGHEYGSLVLDAHAGLDPDGLGAAMGTVRGGGLVVLLTPPLAAWPEVPDPQAERLAVDGWGVEAVTGRFLERLAAKLRGDPCAVVIEQDRPLPQVTPLPAASPTSPPADPDCLTVDQEQAVAAVERVITGHRRRPTVLTADRGRGKSAALGIAAARLMAARGIDVVVTGPHRGAVAAVLRHAAARLGVPVHRGRVQTANGATLRFLLPDEVRQASESPDLVLVDEAAALPATVLTALLERFSRIVFATTVHGYEGTGRGFTLRFRSVLDERTPRWREVVLREPVRWRSGDPVEAWLFDALLLDAALPAVPETNSEQLGVEALDRARLAGDDALLRDVFG